MTEAILRDLGATPEQIDRERARIHADLFGSSMVAEPPSRQLPDVPKPT
jgi:CPA2 family monovalent cation:H+ antiporter-2